ncbi:MAG: methionine adenosyltransferase [Erysipelotrichaceae bacterium]|jgi:S-adenosylmethionine synthetase|nr:methionine adenosyltransferase [Erysipelotrichaceae bacterium]
MKTYFTSESVTPGHPDKVCDQIADAILDEALRQDREAHMAVEATIKDNFVLLYGEAGTKAVLDYPAIAKAVLKDIGYFEDFEVLVKISKQSAEIDAAVVNRESLGAGDQGIMFGYACDETKGYMPLSISLAHQLSRQLTKVYKEQSEAILKPDGKTQVTVTYQDKKIAYLDSIVVSAQHEASITQETLRDYIIEKVITPVVPPALIHADTKFFINPSGSFVVGGPFGDSGTTGRKIVVDTYGGHGRIGGGCLSSKDPSKVDRSAAYYCRYVAKNIVAAGLAKRFEIQVSYAIGMPKPLSVEIETFGTGTVSDEAILKIIENNFDFSVANIIDSLDLKRPIYRATSNFGHFGRSEFPWEQIIDLKR